LKKIQAFAGSTNSAHPNGWHTTRRAFNLCMSRWVDVLRIPTGNGSMKGIDTYGT